MFGSFALSWLAGRWPALLLLAVLMSGWIYGGIQTWRLSNAVQKAEVFAERERQAKVLAFDEQLRQRRIAKETERAYQESAARAAAVAGDVDRRLRAYLARRVPAGAAPVVADGAPAESSGDRRLGELLGGVVRTCSADAARLTALQAWAERVTADAK